MFRSRNFLVFCGLAIAVALPCNSLAQDEPAEAASGLKLKPNVVVQDKMDDETLVAKVSYFMGYKLMESFKQQGQEVDKEMLLKGMKAAIEGPDQGSFVTGYQLMKNMQRQGADFSLDKMYEGINLADAGKELDMSDEQIKAMMTSFGNLVEKKAKEKLKKEAQDNAAATEAYMVKNGANPKVKKLPNGVQYEVLAEGDGASPEKSDTVRVDYHGTFLDGTVFDSTIKSGRPATFPVGGVVPGFSASLQAMKVGSKWRVVIPGELGYGIPGRGKIGPNQALIFEITLLEILEKQSGPPGAPGQ